jgi:tetratricopeptide (TPR) repeat protein
VPAESELWSRATHAHRAGRLDEAEAAYAEILEHNSVHAGALHQLGLLRHQKGQSAEAFELLDAALRIAPDAAPVLSNAAVILQSLTRYEEALALLDRAIAASPDFTPAYGNRGLVLQALGRHAQAADSFDQAVARGADATEMAYRRANSLFALPPRRGPARLWSGAGTPPDIGIAALVCGQHLLALKRLEEALASFECALAIKPDYPEALLNRGNTLSALHRDQQAVAAYDRALAIQPDFPVAWSNRGNSLLELARYDEAVASCDRAIALRRDYAQAHWNRSLIRLLQGELAEGFGEYEWRWKRPEIAAVAPSLPQPRWDGASSLQGKTVLLHAEQGSSSRSIRPSRIWREPWAGRSGFSWRTCPDWRWLLAREDSPWYPRARLLRRRASETWDALAARVRDASEVQFPHDMRVQRCRHRLGPAFHAGYNAPIAST